MTERTTTPADLPSNGQDVPKDREALRRACMKALGVGCPDAVLDYLDELEGSLFAAEGALRAARGKLSRYGWSHRQSGMEYIGALEIEYEQTIKLIDRALATSSRTVPLSKAPAKVVCGYCRAEFDTRADLTRHDNEAHGRKDRLLEERNWLNNSFGQGSAIDGRIRDRIAEIDEMLSEGTVPLSSEGE